MTKTAEVNEFTGRLAELVKQVQAGNEVLLTEGNKPVAKIILATAKEMTPGAPLKIESLKGHRVLTPKISQSEVMEEMTRSGWPPTKKFTKKNEEALLREIHEDRKKHRGA